MFRTVGKVLMYIVLAGLIVALLRAFNMDLFGLFDWLWGLVSGAVTSISDFFTRNPTFQKMVGTPTIITYL